MNISNKRLRDLQRVIHLVGAAILGVYIYSPWGNDPTFAFLTKFVVIPVLIISGGILWQMPRITKRLRRRRSSRQLSAV